MNGSLYPLVVIILLVKSLVQNVFVLYVLQFNEYRLDRFSSYIKRVYKNYLFALPFLTILAPVSSKKLPKITGKSIVLIGLTFLIHMWIWVHFSKSISLVVLLVLITPLIQLGVLVLFSPIEWCIRQYVYTQARAKIKQYKKQGLVVVGITGSYGKSTTKYFLNHMLSSMFNVLSTHGSINTPLGLCRIILSKLTPGQQILIVEMGAYKKGEIAELCSIVNPDIAIITGIGNQHIELFGGQQNIIEGKSELLAALPAQGLAVINDASEHAPLLPDTKLRVEYYGTPDSKTRFDPLLNKVTLPAFLKINVEAALIVAQKLEIPSELLIKNIITLPLPPKTMDTKTGYAGATIIDDSFSSNLQGVLGAIQELADSPKQNKVVVMPCLIELASDAQTIHRQIGQALSEKKITALITTEDNFKSVQDGYADKNQCILVTDPSKAIAWLKENITKNSAVLIEGRVNPTIVEFLGNA